MVIDEKIFTTNFTNDTKDFYFLLPSFRRAAARLYVRTTTAISR